MVLTSSTMLPLGSKAPPFLLPDTNGKMVSIDDLAQSPVLLVMFICNHCPYVKHIRSGLAELTCEYRQKGVAVVGINSNDAANYSADNQANMAQEVAATKYVFPYLYDETQDVAKAYRAACTPEFYVFDKERKLVYRGQMDSSRPGNNLPVSGEDLRGALDAALAGRIVPMDQKPGVGCNIKWKPGNEPDYFR